MFMSHNGADAKWYEFRLDERIERVYRMKCLYVYAIKVKLNLIISIMKVILKAFG